ncbi:MAG: LLM class flavin-dependent oxidoreductase [Dehalococcoidia bacterium]
MTLQVEIDVPVSASVTDQVAYIKRAEELGFSGVALGETLESGHDLFVTMALAARATDRIRMYSAVANPVTRHPLVLANLIRSLSELAPGRVGLGLGLGSSGLALTGNRAAKLNELRLAITSIRDHLGTSGMPSPPILVGASGPRMLGLAGELADEVLLEIGVDKQARGVALEHVASGAERSSRTVGDVALTDYVLLSVSDDPEKAMNAALPWLEYFLRFGTYRLALDMHNIALPVDTLGVAFSRGMLAHLAESLAIVGTPAHVAQRFAALETAGVSRICCMVPGGLKSHQRTMELLARHVLPRLG